MRSTFRAEREFGLIVGGVFSLLGWWWIYFLVLGVPLILAALLIPRALMVPRKVWMKLAEAMAYVSSRIILALVFFLVLTPIGVIKRAMGWDPLFRRERSRESFWHPYPARQQNPRHYEKMF